MGLCHAAMALTKISIFGKIIPHVSPAISVFAAKSFHLTSSVNAWNARKGDPKKFLEYNKVIYPPQAPGEERRPAVS